MRNEDVNKILSESFILPHPLLYCAVIRYDIVTYDLAVFLSSKETIHCFTKSQIDKN